MQISDDLGLWQVRISLASPCSAGVVGTLS